MGSLTLEAVCGRDEGVANNIAKSGSVKAIVALLGGTGVITQGFFFYVE